MIGRPSEYTKEIADKICEEIGLGKSLRTVCEDEKMPVMATVFSWMRLNPDFMKHYAYSCEERSEAMLEDIISISDGGIEEIKHSAEKKSGAIAQIVRLKVDTRKWYMSKMKPKKYGDKLDLTSGGDKLPTPLLHVLDNRSDPQNSGAKKQD